MTAVTLFYNEIKQNIYNRHSIQTFIAICGSYADDAVEECVKQKETKIKRKKEKKKSVQMKK